MKRKAGSEARTRGKKACRAATWRAVSALLKKGDLDLAERKFRRALAARSGFIAAHENVAITLAREGNLDDAVAEFGSILVDRSNWSDAHYNLGVGLLQENDLTGTLQRLQKAVELGPGYAEVYARAGIREARQAGRCAGGVSRGRELESVIHDVNGRTLLLSSGTKPCERCTWPT